MIFGMHSNYTPTIYFFHSSTSFYLFFFTNRQNENPKFIRTSFTLTCIISLRMYSVLELYCFVLARSASVSPKIDILYETEVLKCITNILYFRFLLFFISCLLFIHSFVPFLNAPGWQTTVYTLQTHLTHIIQCYIHTTYHVVYLYTILGYIELSFRPHSILR